ncbi:MAG TPA: serine hydrolase domain-containing protein [Candidatus Acidoferrum sp.]|nr:serine hydrolase domain-containing protein [Candidatus Acidoferrum sp.]
MNTKLILGSLALLLAVTTDAQTLAPQGKNAIDSYLQNAIKTTHVPGMVALVVNKDGIVYEQSFGLRDVANKKPMTNDAIFRLASMTKPITSTGIMMLVEQGKIDLDAPAAKYLPALAKPKVLTSWKAEDGTYTAEPAKHEYTVRQLLTHTSGLGYTFTSDFLAKVMTMPGARATQLPLLFEPGTKWNYGESTRVLGEIIEAVSGQELSAYLDAHILKPLHMDDTSYDIPAAKNARVVTTHRLDNGKLVEVPNPGGAITAAHQGDGGLSGTARDYAQFIRLILNDGKLGDSGQLLKPTTLATMEQSGTNGVKVGLMKSTNKTLSEDFPLGAGVDTYALGFQRTEQQAAPNMRSVGSLAWAGIYNTEFWIDPQRKIGAVLLMQYLPFYDKDAIDVLQGFESRVYSNLK